MEESLVKTIIEQVSSHGIFALLFVILFGAILKGAWVAITKFTAMTEKNITTIVDSNSKFAESSEKMADLIEIFVKQQELTNQQLKFIKKLIQKNNITNVEVINIVKILMKDNPEALLRLDNLIKEIQRSIEDV